MLAAGVAVELLAPSSSTALTLADFLVGASFAVAGAALLPRARIPGTLALAFAATWFIGTLSGASSAFLSGFGSALVLAHRGPLLHLLVAMPTGRPRGQRQRAVAGGAWIAGLLPLAAARPATAVAALLTSTTLLGRARQSVPHQQRPLLAGAVGALALALVWALALVTTEHATLLVALDDLTVVCAGYVALSASAGAWSLGATRDLVVELGPARHVGRPVSAQLARIMGDPALEVLYRVPGFGWVDEQGRARESPGGDGRVVTRASAPGGGEVALVHGDSGADPRLSEAAAAAAALVMDAARLEAGVRGRAVDVAASRRRLLMVADAERRALEERLRAEVVAPLHHVEQLLQAHPDTTPLLAELRDAVDEIVALGRGVYPPALARADLSAALMELAERCPCATVVEVDGPIDSAPERLREVAWFVCSEALANVARHAHAHNVHIRAQIAGASLEVEIRDDGIGGAGIERGLRGLADRVEALGGALSLRSPRGGPTIVRAALPLANQDPPLAKVQGPPR